MQRRDALVIPEVGTGLALVEEGLDGGDVAEAGQLHDILGQGQLRGLGRAAVRASSGGGGGRLVCGWHGADSGRSWAADGRSRRRGAGSTPGFMEASWEDWTAPGRMRLVGAP